MERWSEHIANLDELEELLSRPSAELVRAMGALEGDLIVLGASGKIGPTLVRRALRAVQQAGVSKRIYAVARSPMPELAAAGAHTLACDLLDLAAVQSLPRVANVIYMAGRKFGSSGGEWLTWAANVLAPHNVARTFTEAQILVFSTGCVYPLVNVTAGGSTERDAPGPVGEYAMSCLGRERVFDYFSTEQGARVLHIRLNYAVELRYGVLVDVASRVWLGQPVDVTTGYANVIWQGDVCDQVLRAFSLASSPSRALNLTGPETISIRWLAQQFGELLRKPALIQGQENGLGYLSNAALAASLLGYPQVPLGVMMRWVADWIQHGGQTPARPTHFEVQDGQY
jgi:nucleoside-diphosphate-sugar epimerase